MLLTCTSYFAPANIGDRTLPVEPQCFQGTRDKPSHVGSIFASILFVLLFLILNRPEVIVIQQLGSVVWYPATGLLVAFILTFGHWYALLGTAGCVLAGMLINHQPMLTFSGTIGTAAVGFFYRLAAYALRGRWQIDLGLRRRRDVCVTSA